MSRLGVIAVVLGSLILSGCTLCWPRGGGLQTCPADDDDDDDDDDDSDDDDDDDDSGDDDDDSSPHPCDGPPPGGSVVDAMEYALICVREGEFTMGSPSFETGRGADEVQHRVALTRPFLLGRTEVTQRLWQEVWGSQISDCAYGCGDTHPVLGATWLQATAWLNLLSEEEGLTPAYTPVVGDLDMTWDPAANGWRLPTEAEWEYAARAGEATMYAGSDDWTEVAWCDTVNDLPYEGRPVGTKAANAWGFVDMSGNAAEWTWDVMTPYPSGPGVTTDPTGPATGFMRTHRGGAFPLSPNLCRVADRHANFSTDDNWNRGFRIARTLTP